MFSLIIRLIELLILLSVIRSVVVSVLRFFGGNHPIRGPVRFRNTQQPASTTLKQDPVCGTYVAIDTSLKKVVAGQVYHFCSPECRNKFDA